MFGNYLKVGGSGGKPGQRYSREQSKATASTKCQKCLGMGHFTADCKGQRQYAVRPTRTQILKHPKLATKLTQSLPPALEPKEGTAAAILAANEAKRAKLAAEAAAKDTKRGRSRSRSSSVSSSGSSRSSSSGSGSSRSRSDSRSRSGSVSGSDRSRSRSRSVSPKGKTSRRGRSLSRTTSRSISRSPSPPSRRRKSYPRSVSRSRSRSRSPVMKKRRGARSPSVEEAYEGKGKGKAVERD